MMLEQDDWNLDRTRGSHRQFEHTKQDWSPSRVSREMIWEPEL